MSYNLIYFFHMKFSVYQGKINIIEPEGKVYNYENFIVTSNPDGTRSLRSVSRSPKKDLFRDVYQKETKDWRPLEAYGSLYYKNKFQGSVQRRVQDNRLHSWLWSNTGDCDYQVFDISKNTIIGFHAIFHESWKMRRLSNHKKKFQEIITYTVSNTWNGMTLDHGSILTSKARPEGSETIEVAAGKFSCEKYLWLTPFGKKLAIWSFGDDSIFIKMEVLKGNNKGVIYELSEFKKT
ncbi:MAG: hypothetical protein CMM18_03570 [Rhodospirillaceae bacterium]|nr:hypothetical protein [Rhodospirillaceae bacterium]